MIGNLNYYAKKTGQEIDFILDETVALEVKETPILFDLKTVKRRAKSINIQESFLVGLEIAGSGFDDFIFGGAIY